MIFRRVLAIFLASQILAGANLLRGESDNAGIFGAVYDPDGAPVSSSVTAFRLEVNNGKVVALRACVVATDREGNFNCLKLASGAYILVINPTRNSPEIELRAVGSKVSDPPPRFFLFPVPAGGSIGYFLKLKPGAMVQAQVHVQPDMVSELHLPAHAGAATHWCEVHWQDQASTFTFSIPVYEGPCTSGIGSSKTALAGIPSGIYSVVESWFESNKKIESTCLTNTSEISGDCPVLSLRRKGKLAGDVIIDDASLVSKNPSIDHALHLAFIPTFGASVNEYRCPVSSDHSFAINGIDAGFYDVSTDAMDHTYVRDILANGKSLGAELIEVPNDNTYISYQLTIARTNASISGLMKLSGDEPAPSVLLRRVGHAGSIIIRPDKTGRFRADGIAPGNYEIFGWADISHVPYRDERFLKYTNPQPVRISITANSLVDRVEVDPSSFTAPN